MTATHRQCTICRSAQSVIFGPLAAGHYLLVLRVILLCKRRSLLTEDVPVILRHLLCRATVPSPAHSAASHIRAVQYSSVTMGCSRIRPAALQPGQDGGAQSRQTQLCCARSYRALMGAPTTMLIGTRCGPSQLRARSIHQLFCHGFINEPVTISSKTPMAPTSVTRLSSSNGFGRCSCWKSTSHPPEVGGGDACDPQAPPAQHNIANRQSRATS